MSSSEFNLTRRTRKRNFLKQIGPVQCKKPQVICSDIDNWNKLTLLDCGEIWRLYQTRLCKVTLLKPVENWPGKKALSVLKRPHLIGQFFPS